LTSIRSLTPCNEEHSMNAIRAAQAGQGGLVTIACINKAKTGLGVPFDEWAFSMFFLQRTGSSAAHHFSR
jgi:hypothetical protein